MRTQREPPSICGGFSQIELLISMGVAAILAAMAIPQLPALSARYQLSNATRQVISDLQRARMKAVGENAIYRIVFSREAVYQLQTSPNGTTFTNDGASIALPRGVSFVGTLPQPTFTRLGTLVAEATVTLTNAIGETKTVHVNILGNINTS